MSHVSPIWMSLEMTVGNGARNDFWNNMGPRRCRQDKQVFAEGGGGDKNIKDELGNDG